MVFDYSKLKGRIIEKYGTQYAFVDAMGMSYTTLWKKLNNMVDWSVPEMLKACNLLEIPLEEAYLYFFN